MKKIINSCKILTAHVDDSENCLTCIHSYFDPTYESFICNRQGIEVNTNDFCQHIYSREDVKNTNVVRW